MNEATKTVAFVALALVGLGVGVASRPRAVAPATDVVGKLLAPDFTDPSAAHSLEIVDYNADTAEPNVFKVKQVNGIWSLPSRYDYPADAKDQLAAAATSLIDLKILQLASDKPSDHALYGVVDPVNAESGADGVGKHVILSDSSGKKLLDVVIGKEAKGDQTGLRYIRESGKSPVYLVKVATDKLNTRFDNWIEKDLLKLNAWDIGRVYIDSYSVDEVNGRKVPGDVLDLTYNDKEGKWLLPDLKEGEELDTTKLNEMKTALDDLKIVDVRKKPAGLSRDLKTEEGIALDQQTVGSLASKGFYLTQDGELWSNEGDVIVGTNEGVQYVLRFGEVALGTEEAADEEKKPDDAADATKAEAAGDKPAGETKEKGANRYLFLMAQFDPDLIPKPELDPIPGEPQPAAPAETAPAADTPASDAPAGETPPAAEAPAATEPSTTEPATESAPAEAPKPSEGPTPEDESKAEPAAAAESEIKAPETTAEAPPAANPADPAPADAPATDAPPAEAAPAAADAKPADAKPKTPEEIERIKAENKRKQDEYDAKVKKGQEK
ncbi:MAG: DUF4340 domain-containing protein, partial [Pirellulales bacterium]|nr:DUF4340 domain-containing protein [Pirellulales bacterium]